jgi:peptidase E
VTLTGGGPGTFLALRRMYKAALAETGRARPLVAYVGTASHDSGGFFAMIRAGFAVAGARMRLAKIASPRASMAAARALLEDADLVFVSGGDVEAGMKVLHERGMAAPLVALAHAGKPMFGMSAGSIMLAREWVRFPDDDDTRAEIFPCLGIAPVHVDAHAEDDGWAELRTLLRLCARRGTGRDGALVGYGLTRKGGLRVRVDGHGAQIEALGTDIPRFGVRHGHSVQRAPLRLGRS